MPVYKLEVENYERSAQEIWEIECASAQAARVELIVALKRAGGDSLKKERNCDLVGRMRDATGNVLYTAKLSYEASSPNMATI